MYNDCTSTYSSETRAPDHTRLQNLQLEMELDREVDRETERELERETERGPETETDMETDMETEMVHETETEMVPEMEQMHLNSPANSPGLRHQSPKGDEEDPALLGGEQCHSFQRFPKVSLLESMSSKYALWFKLWDTDVSMANSLRRIMMVEVPTVAIDLVEITTNSSVMLDEFIAHRLGLIPLTSQGAMAMRLPEECPCESESSCQQCSVELTLNVTSTSEGEVVVTSRDLISANDSVVPVDFDVDLAGREQNPASKRYGGIVITKLLKGQEIAVRAVARKGVGSLHAKWSPVATVTFHQEPEIFINEVKMEKLTLPEKQAWVNSSLAITQGLSNPAKVFKLETNSGKVEVVSPGAFTGEELFRNAQDSETAELFEIQARDDSFIFSVESTGAIPAAKIFLNAIKVLKQKLLALRLAEDGSPLAVADHEMGAPSPERNHNYNQSVPDDVPDGFASTHFEEEPKVEADWDSL